MPEYLSPAVYVEEVSSGIKPIEGVGTSTGAFIGVAEKGPIGGAIYENGEVGRPELITNFGDFVRNFGGYIEGEWLAYAVKQFFTEGGTKCYVVRTAHFEDITDPLTLKAKRSVTQLSITQNSAQINILNIYAINEGEWGNDLQIGVNRSGVISTTLKMPAGLKKGDNRLTLGSANGIDVGTSLSIYDNSSSELTAKIQVLRIEPENKVVFRTISGIDGTIPDGSVVVGVKPGKASSVLKKSVLSNSDQITIENRTGFEIGSIILIQSDAPKSKIERNVITRIVGNQFFLNSKLKNDFPVESIVTTEDFSVSVYLNDDLVEVHPNLSLEDTNKTDFVENRINIGATRSRYIRVKEFEQGNPGAEIKSNTPPDSTLALLNLTGGLNGDEEDKFDYIGSEAAQTGFHAFDSVDDVNILAAPGIIFRSVISYGMTYCENRKDLFYVAEVTPAAQTVTEVLDFKNATGPYAGEQAFNSKYGAIYWPWVKVADPLTKKDILMPPSGAVIGSYSATDVRRGVHKAPAGIEDGFLNSVVGIQKIVTKGEHDLLNPDGVNVIRSFPGQGIVIWGARTVSKDSEWKYINVRRLFLFLEESIDEGTQWVVFEPNDTRLWAKIIRNISAFLRVQWLEGKLVGSKPEEAFFVKCDAETNPQESVDLGRVITEIGVAPSKPAEFVIFRIMQTRPGGA